MIPLTSVVFFVRRYIPLPYLASAFTTENLILRPRFTHLLLSTRRVQGSWNSEANHLASARSKYVPIDCSNSGT